MGVRITKEQAAAIEAGAATLYAGEFAEAMGRSRAGRAANKRGARFETVLADEVHEGYWRDGRAAIYRLPVATAPMPPKNAAKSGMSPGIARILSKRQHCDFLGALCEPPFRVVAMEAKACATAMASLPIIREGLKDRFGLKEHQLRALGRYARRCNAVAAVVWRNGSQVLVLGPDGIMEAESAISRPKGRYSIPVGKFRNCEDLDWLRVAMNGWSEQP